jgi:hypothetical protein
MHVGGGGATNYRHRVRGGATTHIFTESSESKEGGGACGSGWSLPPPAYVREEERCGDGQSFPHRGIREEERCGSREKQTSCSSLRSASS